VRAVAFIFAQETPRQVDFTTFIVPIDEVEQRSGLDFFWELPDEVENALESQPGMWPLPGPGVSRRVPSPEGVSSTGRLVAHRRR
jgi:hypothetical protein